MAVLIIRTGWHDFATTYIGPFNTEAQARAWLEADEKAFGHTPVIIETLCASADATAIAHRAIATRREAQGDAPAALTGCCSDAMHLLTPDGKPIRGTLETISACGAIKGLHLEADGSIGFDFDGWVEQWIEDARPVQQPHPDTGRLGFILVDFAGTEYHENDLLRCLPGARIAGCPYCADALVLPGQVTA